MNKMIDAHAVPEQPMPEKAKPSVVGLEMSVKIIGGIIAAMVGLYALFDNSSKSYAAFDAQAREEIKYWHGLRDQYFKIIERPTAPDDETKRIELSSICVLANGNPSSLEGRTVHTRYFMADNGYMKAKRDEIRDAKNHLVKIIAGNPLAESTEDCRSLIKDQKDENEKIVQAENAQETPVATKEPVVKPALSEEAKAETVRNVAVDEAIVQQMSNVQASPVSLELARRTIYIKKGDEKGYDIDLFWCERPASADDEKRIYALAVGIAGELKKVARIGNWQVGRVRLKPLTAAKQIEGEYPNKGFEVRGEDGEAAQRDGLARWLSGLSQGAQFKGTKAWNSTPFYLSIFVCDPPTIKPALPLRT